MKLRKRLAQPLNLTSVDHAPSTPGPNPTQAPQTQAANSDLETPPPAASDAMAAAPWPSGLADSEWTSGWADPEAPQLEASALYASPLATIGPIPPPTSDLAKADLSEADIAVADTTASAAPAAATVDGTLAVDLDRPPLRQGLSSLPTPPSSKAKVKARAKTKAPTSAAAELTAAGDAGDSGKIQLDRGREALAPLGLRYNPPKSDVGVARYAYLFAGLGAFLWSGSFIAFMVAFQKGVAPLTYVPFQSTILAVLTVLPAAFMILAAYAIRQGAAMAAEARIARRLAQDMVLPAAQAASQTTDVLEAVRREVDRAASATRAALDEMSVLRDALTQETDRLTEAAGDAQRTARIVGETLANERDEIAQLSRELRSNAEDVAAAVNQQTQLVAEASDLARSQLQEAEATLVARAADLTSVAAIAGAAAKDAGEHLAHQTQFLDSTGAALAERLRKLDERLGEQREGLGALVDRCNEDQDEIAARLESRRAQLIDTIAHARLSATELTEASGESAESLRELITAVADQMHELVQTAQAERVALGQNAADSYAAVADQARYAQEAASAHVESARQQVEQLGQFAFDAGQRANQAFEGRIAEARHLIEQSAAMVEDAGIRSAARIEVGVAASRSALDDLNQALAEVDSRISKLPEDARTQADAVRDAVERAAAELAAAVRKLSLETKAVEDSFQARVRKSYETLKSQEPLAPTKPPVSRPPESRLSEPQQSVVRPVDAISPDLGQPAFKPLEIRPLSAAASLSPPKPSPSTPRPDPADVEALRRTLAAEEEEAEEDLGFTFSGARIDLADTKGAADHSSQRQRLRLTPTDADTALKSVFDPLQGRGRDAAPPRLFTDRAERAGSDRAVSRSIDPNLDDWTWKDLLSSIDETPATDDALAGLMIDEINALGVDAGALLPRVRLEEISNAAVTMGPTAVRDTVRRLAPAAVRRLSRRVLTDKILKEQADRYLRRYVGLLQGSIEKDPSIVSTLLGSDPGRAYLLLDAAVGDLH
jgi:hypothetical protein